MTAPPSILVGAAVIGATTAAGAAGLYYASLPSHVGPENASPPPEGIGLIVGALLGCGLGAAVVSVATRSPAIAAASYAVAAAAGSVCWLLLGSDTLGSRTSDAVAGVVVCGLGAVLGIALGVMANQLRR